MGKLINVECVKILDPSKQHFGPKAFSYKKTTEKFLFHFKIDTHGNETEFSCLFCLSFSHSPSRVRIIKITKIK